MDFDFYDDGDEPFDTFDPETQIKLEDARKLSAKYNVGDFVQVEIIDAFDYDLVGREVEE